MKKCIELVIRKNLCAFSWYKRSDRL